MLTIPFDNTLNSFQEQVELDGVTYLLEFVWNDRDLAWFMSILEIDGTPILEGVKLVLGVELIRWAPSAALPPGEFWMSSADPAKLVIAKTDIPEAVALIYVPEAER